MTLVVARLHGSQISLVADTLLTEHSVPLPPSKGTVKLCLLPGNLCVGFSNSPELAERSFAGYAYNYPEGTSFAQTIEYFGIEGSKTGNDFIIAFGGRSRIIKIVDGKRIDSIAKTVWIGDKLAYERFKEIEITKRGSHQGRAVDAVLFGDEVSGSQAGNLYPTMRDLTRDRSVPSVGGFVTAASTRGDGFRFSIYSDTLFDWPSDYPEDYAFDLNYRSTLNASGENLNYCLTQISPKYMNANFVRYYLLKGKKLFFYYGISNGLANKCFVLSGVEPEDIASVITKSLGLDLAWLVWVISSYGNGGICSDRGETSSGNGVQLSLFCHANTCPVDQTQSGLLRIRPASETAS